MQNRYLFEILTDKHLNERDLQEIGNLLLTYGIKWDILTLKDSKGKTENRTNKPGN